jgi:hypothetical protein
VKGCAGRGEHTNPRANLWSDEQKQDYIIDVIMIWIEKEYAELARN